MNLLADSLATKDRNMEAIDNKFEYGILREKLSAISWELDKNGYIDEALAINSLTNIIGYKIEPSVVNPYTEKVITYLEHSNRLQYFLDETMINK